ncbi:MAG: 4-aminobutyrate--2-oxoglutarate transaminase [Desulfovibrio sp.]|nr:4-aminobutyrate--2-oxoglutarate transaminase [Desulfovibrio sp.]
MATNNELQTRRTTAIPKGIASQCAFYAAKARNAEIWDTEGKRYIDFAGGIGVLNAGHGHPKVKAAIAAQLERFSHTCYHVVPHDLYIRAAERINALTPGTAPKKTAFFSTGAEAVENAVKIARCYTGRPGIIAFNDAFHGRTNLTLGLTGKVKPYKVGFGPFPGSICHVPFPGAARRISAGESLRAIRNLFKTTIEASGVAAIIVEPVQGEGGFNVAPAELITGLRALCDENGIVLIHDEVQCGFGRTGRMFASEYYGIEPDIIAMAKSMGGGFPISAVSGKAHIMDAPSPGGLGGTYAGSPLGLAAVNAVLDIYEEEDICSRSLTLGGRCRARLENVAAEIPQIREVRGLGSMLAIEFMKPGTDEPDAETAARVQAAALADGLILLTCGPAYNNIRLLYPLTIEEAIFDEALAILEKALRRQA